MSYIPGISAFIRTPLTLTSLCVATLAGCGGSSDGESVGYINLYNASANAPGIFLTLDEDLENDDDDEFENTYASVTYADASGNYELDTNNYYIELAWQDEDSSDRDDLEKIYEDQIEISKDEIKFVVVAEDFQAPKILTYDIPVIDDDDDDDDELFNLRLLNMHDWSAGVDVYLSKSDETFNEAVLIASPAYTELTENQKFDQDDYIFYLTSAGSDEVLYQSDEIAYSYSSQYVMVIRQNPGVDKAPFVLDKVSNSNIVAYEPDGAKANFRVFNGLQSHELLPNYQESFDLHLDGVDDSPEISALGLGEFSETIVMAHGDYSVDLTISENGESIIQNHLLTLNENQEKTVFFYLLEEDVDHDGDGDVDEDGDGIVDEIEITVNSLVVNNNIGESIYDHDIQIIHFIDNDDISIVNFYFVRNDEMIDTADNKRIVSFADPETITLLNNTYTVYAVATVDSSDLILTTTKLTLTEESKNQFILLEEDADSPTGYSMVIADQKEESATPE